jgi:hypothetical protein
LSIKIIENPKRINFENEDLRREQDKLILNRIDGTFNIFKVKISISIDLNENKVYVNVEIDGKTVISGTLDENNLCIKRDQEICYNPVCLENIEVCIDWNGKKVTAKGKICLTVLCQEFDIILIQW